MDDNTIKRVIEDLLNRKGELTVFQIQTELNIPKPVVNRVLTHNSCFVRLNPGEASPRYKINNGVPISPPSRNTLPQNHSFSQNLSSPNSSYTQNSSPLQNSFPSPVSSRVSPVSSHASPVLFPVSPVSPMQSLSSPSSPINLPLDLLSLKEPPKFEWLCPTIISECNEQIIKSLVPSFDGNIHQCYLNIGNQIINSGPYHSSAAAKAATIIQFQKESHPLRCSRDIIQKLQYMWTQILSRDWNTNDFYCDEYFLRRDINIPERLLISLPKLKFSRSDSVNFFKLNSETGEVQFHPSFLNKLQCVEEEYLEYFLILFLVHESIHRYQGTHSYNYSGIGTTGFAKGMDEYADTMAAFTASLYRQNKTMETYSSSCQFVWNIVLRSIQLFDTFPLEHPTEARINRYLTTLVRHALAGRANNETIFKTITSDRWDVSFCGCARYLNDEEVVSVDVKRTKEKRTEVYVMYSVNSGTETKKIKRDPKNFEPVDIIEHLVRGEIMCSTVNNGISYIMHEITNYLPHI